MDKALLTGLTGRSSGRTRLCAADRRSSDRGAGARSASLHMPYSTTRYYLLLGPWVTLAFQHKNQDSARHCLSTGQGPPMPTHCRLMLKLGNDAESVLSRVSGACFTANQSIFSVFHGGGPIGPQTPAMPRIRLRDACQFLSYVLLRSTSRSTAAPCGLCKATS